MCLQRKPAAVHWTDEEESGLQCTTASGYKTRRSAAAARFVVDMIDDALATMRGLIDAELTFSAISALNQQTEWLHAKVAGAGPGAVFFALVMLRRKLSRILPPLQALAAECVQTDPALFKTSSPRSPRSPPDGDQDFSEVPENSTDARTKSGTALFIPNAAL